MKHYSRTSFPAPRVQRRFKVPQHPKNLVQPSPEQLKNAASFGYNAFKLPVTVEQEPSTTEDITGNEAESKVSLDGSVNEQALLPLPDDTTAPQPEIEAPAPASGEVSQIQQMSDTDGDEAQQLQEKSDGEITENQSETLDTEKEEKPSAYPPANFIDIPVYTPNSPIAIQEKLSPFRLDNESQQEDESGISEQPNLEETIQQKQGSGEELSDDVRQPMEDAFGADFSGVKVHTDATSDKLNKSIQAKAFTTGKDIFFWEHVQEHFGDLKETVIEEIKGMLITQVITAGVKWIIGLLNPASAFVKAAMAIYDIVMFFVNQGSQVVELVSAVTDAVVAIASGAVGGAAKLVENALAKSLPVVIGFLASLLGIGDLAKKVQGIVGKIRQRIDLAIEKVLQKAKSLFKGKKGKGNKDTEITNPDKQKEVDQGLLKLHQEEAKYAKNGKLKREDAQKVAKITQDNHTVFNSITVIDGGQSWKYQYVIQKTNEDSNLEKANDEPIRISFSKSRHLLKGIGKSNTPIKENNTVILEDFNQDAVNEAARQVYQSTGKGSGTFSAEGISWQYDKKISDSGDEYLHINPTHSPPKAVNLNRSEPKAINNYLSLREKGKSHDEALAKLKELANNGIYSLTESFWIVLEAVKP